MSYFPPPQPNYQQAGQFLPPTYQPQMTPYVPQSSAIPSVPQGQRMPPFQPPTIPQIIPQTVAAAAPPGMNPIPIPTGIPYLPQPGKMPPPQPQRQPPASLNLNQDKTTFVWSRKKEKMPWGMAESIDVEQIVRRGDLKSVLFFMEKFVNANITNDDKKYFGSKGSLNSFLILQLGTEYLFSECKRLEEESEESPSNFQEIIDNMKNQYDEKVAIYNEELKKREDRIDELKLQIKEYKSRNQQLKDAINQRKSKKNRNKSSSTFGTHKHNHETKSNIESMESDEPGLIHENTIVKQLKKYNQDSDKKKSHNNKIVINNDSSNSTSEGEIKTGLISAKIEPLLPDDEEGYEDGLLSLEEEEEENESEYNSNISDEGDDY